MSFVDPRELDFLLYDWLRVAELTAAKAFSEHSRETFDALLDLSAKLATSKFATHYKKADRDEPAFDGETARTLPDVKDALEAFAEAGLFAATFATELGGMQVPSVIHSAAMSHFYAANIATSAYAMLTAANARLLSTFGTPRQVETFAHPQIEGRWFGTMCLSEPQAGSSLADITTRAIPDGEDIFGARYRLFGNKMWISGGEHEMTENIVHLVLAKVPGPDGRLVPGVGGISLFVVPKRLVEVGGPLGERNDVALAGLNHKMGYRGTTNCLLSFGEGTRFRPAGSAGAVGYLVGDVGQGLSIMFQMMNEARIAIGLGAAALGCRGYRQSLDYARQRLQGRSARGGRKDPASPQVPIIEHADVKRMLLAQKCYSEGALALVLYCAKLVDERACSCGDVAAELEALLDLLTPVAKSWPSEFCLEANSLAIQVLGGYGYTREFDVEQVYRDNRLNPIHEGTTGIQALDLLGRKILRDGGRALDILGRRVLATADASSGRGALSAYGAPLRAAWREVVSVTRDLAASNRPQQALDNAWAFLPAFGHVVVGWLWLDTALVALDRAGTSAENGLMAGKLWACRYFFEIELPRARQQLGFVGSRSGVVAEMPSGAF